MARNLGVKEGVSLKESCTLPAWMAGRSIVLVGLMGAGKTSIGRRLAARLGLPFRDADSEIELAAGCTIAELFERFGEREFRDGERRVIRRLLSGDPLVLATGGGAFMDADTRATIRREAVSIWLRCRLPVLLRRVAGPHPPAAAGRAGPRGGAAAADVGPPPGLCRGGHHRGLQRRQPRCHHRRRCWTR